MVKKILLAIVAVIAIFIGVVAVQPSDFSVTRSTTIAAPASEVFPHVNDFHQWEAWSPWIKMDPSSKVTFTGPAEGKDAVFTWAGNEKVGEGKMTIVESHPSDLVKIDLEFIKPFPGRCDTEFTFKPEGGKTLVNWTMKGHNDFMGKAFCLFMDMDKMVGGDFEKGLASMKEIIESPKKEPAKEEAAEKEAVKVDPPKEESTEKAPAETK